MRCAIGIDLITALLLLGVPWSTASGQIPWTTKASFTTPVGAGNISAPMIAGPNGDLYIAAMAGFTDPTGKFGDFSQGWTSISRVDASGKPIFADWIGGVRYATAVGVTASGDGLIAGTTYAAGLPVTIGAWAPTSSGDLTKFVCEVSAGSGTPVFCTYLKSAQISITALGSDAAGDVYILADRGGDPATVPTPGALSLGATTYLMKLDPTGSAMLWIAELGGKSTAMAVDPIGNVYLTGIANPADFPGTGNGQTSSLFVAKVNSSGSKLGFAAFGGADDNPAAIAVDGAGTVYITGNSVSNNASFAAKLSADGTRFVYHTTLPLNPNNGSLLQAGETRDLAVDGDGNAIIVGFTAALTPHVLTATCRQANLRYGLSSALEGFMVRVGPDGSLLQSTFVGAGTTPVLALGITGGPAQAYITVVRSDLSGAGILQVGADTAGTSVTSIGCMANAATFAAGTLVPGEIFSIFGEGLGPVTGAAVPLGTDGRFPNEFSGVRVTFDDLAAPLLFVQSGQINAITPWELAGKTSTRMCASYAGHTSCVTASLGQAAPGFFLVSPTPVPGDAAVSTAVVNQDGSLNGPGNPAHAGSIVSLYGTGLGPVSPPATDGSLTQLPVPALVFPVKVYFQPSYLRGPGSPTVIIAGEVLYAGPAPLEVSGLDQINVRVPASVGSLGAGTFNMAVEVQLPDAGIVSIGSGLITIAP